MENKTTTQKLDLSFNRLDDNYGIIFGDFREKVETAYPSIYTKADVLLLMDDLLKSIKNLSSFTRDEVLEIIPVETPNFNDEFYEGISEVIEREIEKRYEGCFDINSDECELSLDYNNKVEVENVAYDFDYIGMGEYVVKAIKSHIQNTTTTKTENNVS
jgi:hypothetical protein